MTPNSFKRAVLLACALLFCLAGAVRAQVPQIINYQGRITVEGTNFNGNGQFKFALVDGSGTTLWSNAPMSAGQPNAFVVLPVANGIYSVFLGDTVMANMAAIPAGVFTNADVRLRIWFNNGVIGFQQLSPDQRIGAVGYAIMAGSVPDGAITSSKIAAGAVTGAAIANGAVGSAQLAAGAVTGAAIADGSITGAAFADGSIAGTKLTAGSVTATQIADGSIPATKLERAYDSGTFSIYGEDLTGYPASLDKAIPFTAAFTTVPTVSLGLQGEFASLFSTPPGYSVQSRNLTGFTLRTPIERMLRNVMPVVSTAISSSGVASRSITAADMVMLATGPALAYVEEGTLVYRRSSNIEGTAWEEAVSIGAVDSGTRIDLHLSAGNPAIALTTGAGALRFTRATDAAGTTWGALTTVAASGVNSRPIGGRANLTPGIVVHDFINKRLQFYRATTISGSAWAAAVNLTATNGCRAEHWDFTTVSGSPAVVFSSAPTTDADADLFFLRATATDGSTWPASATTVRQDAANTRIIGISPRFVFIGGNPAVVHLDEAYQATITDPTGTEGANRVEQLPRAAQVSRASDSLGTTWAAPVTIIASASLRTNVATGVVGNTLNVCLSESSSRRIVEEESSVFGTYETSRTVQGNFLLFYSPISADGSAWSFTGDALTARQPDRSIHSLSGKPAWLAVGTNEAVIDYALSLGRVLNQGIQSPGQVIGQALSGSQRDNSEYQQADLRKIELPRPATSTAQTNGVVTAGTLQDGMPFVTVFDPGDKALKFARSADGFGVSWQGAVTLAQVGGGANNRLYRNQVVHYGDGLIFEGPFGASRLPVPVPQTYVASLGDVAGVPAVAFSPAVNSKLYFARATGYDGLAWNAPVEVLASGSQGWEDVQLLTVNGNPAVFYSGGGAIRMVRATDAQGTAWAAPVTVANDADFHFNAYGFKAAIIAGNPAVAYCAEGGGSFRVRFRRATDASGATWPAATNAITQAIAGTGSELNTIALAEIGGTPAIALNNAQVGKLFYSRSTVAAGTSGWGAPIEIDAMVGVDDSFATQRVAMAPGPKPVILYNKFDAPFSADLKCVAANDANGTSWGAPRVLLEDGNAGWNVSLVMDGTVLRGACHDVTNNRLLRLRSTDNGSTWESEGAGNAFASGEHHTAVVAPNGNVVVLYQQNTGLWVRRSTDASAAAWTFAAEIQGKVTPGSPGKGNGYFPSAANVAGALCVAYYDADNGDLYFKRSTNNGANWFASVLVHSTNDVGGYSSIAEVNGAACIAYYDFTNRNLKFARMNAAGTSVEAISFPVSTPGNGEHCQLTVLDGKPAILYYSAASKDLRLVRSTDVNGFSWAAPEVVDSGVVTTTSGTYPYFSSTSTDDDVGRFCRIVTINGKPSVTYFDGTNRRILYRRAGNAAGTSWGGAVTLRDNTQTAALFPVLTSVQNAPGVYFFEDYWNNVKLMLPARPFSIGWTAVEE